MQFSTQAVLGAVLLLAFNGIATAQCPDKQGCFRSPAGCGDTGAAACELLVTWVMQGTDINFVMSGTGGSQAGNRYLTIGISADTLMGDDDILLCRQKEDGTTIVLEHYWSIDTPSKTIVKETNTLEQDGITNVVTSFTNDVISCEFTRAVSVAGQAHVADLAATTTADNMPMFYLLFGVGPVIGDSAVQHEKNPVHSMAGVDFNTTTPAEITAGAGKGSDSSASHEKPGGAAPHMIASLVVLMMTSLLTIYLN